MTTVTGTVKTVGGKPDRSKWVFTSLLRKSGDGDSIVSTNLSMVTPNVDGLLTVELDPGPVIVKYGNTTVTVTVPDEDIDLWDLIAADVLMPPGTTDQKIAAATMAYLQALGPVVAAGDDKAGARSAINAAPADDSGKLLSSALPAAAVTSLGKADSAVQPGVMTDAIAAALAALSPTAVGWDIIPIIGQSNALGRGLGINTEYIDGPDSRIFQFANLSSPYPDQVVAAKDPLFHQELPGSTVGHALAFAKLYASAAPVNRRVLLDPCAHGNTGFGSTGTYTWRVGQTGPINLYDLAVAQIDKALALPGQNRIAAFLWHQGEQNSQVGAGPAYRTDLLALIDALRTRYGANIPFILGQMSPSKIASDAGVGEIDAVHQAIPGLRTHVGMWKAAPLYNAGDDTHFSADGQRINGATAFKAFVLALGAGGVANRDPLPAPVLTGLAAPSATETTIGLSWNAIPRVTKFLVRHRIGTGSFANDPDVAGTATSTMITGLTQNTPNYELQVAPVGVDATGSWVSVTKATPAAVPPGFSDNFNAADGTLDFTTDGKAWQTSGIGSGGPAVFRRDSGAAHIASGFSGANFAFVDSGAANGVLTFTIRDVGTINSGHIGGILFRYVDINNYWYVAFRSTSTDFKYRLYKRIAGVLTLVSTASTAVSTNGDVGTLSFVNGTITLKIGATTVLSPADQTELMTAMNHGLYVGAPAAVDALIESIDFVAA